MSATFRSAAAGTASAATSFSIPAPASVAAGDVLLALITTSSPYMANGIAATGWYLLQASIGYSTTGTYGSLYYKVATANEPSSYTFNVDGAATDLNGVILDYYGGVFDAIVVTDASALYTTYTADTVATSQPNETIVCFWLAGNNTSGTTTSIVLPSTVTNSRANQAPSTTPAYTGIAAGDYTGPSAAGNTSPGTATQSAGTPPSLAWGQVSVTLKVSPPLAPTLSSPVNGSYADLYNYEPTFDFPYNSGGASGGQVGYEFRQAISGAAYAYWDAATSAWSSTVVQNGSVASPITEQYVTFAIDNANWATGNTYNWSAASIDVDGVGPFASDSQVTSQIAPTVTVTAPAAEVTSQTPIASWTETLAPSASQASYRVATYDVAQYTSGTFSPGSGPSVDDSGVITSANQNYTIATPLPAGGAAYRCYVQITQSPGGQPSPWTYSAFTVAANVPHTPTIVSAAYNTDPTTGMPRLEIQVQAQDNILSAVDSSFETGVGSYTGSNATLAQEPNQHLYGSYSLGMTSVAAGEMYTYGSKYTAGPAQEYTAMASFMTAATAESCTVSMEFFNSSGTLLQTNTSSAVVDSTSGWTQALVTATSPANTASVQLFVYVLSTAAVGELHYVDGVGIFPQSTSAWSLGGWVGTTGVTLLRSDGVYVRYASPANPAPVPSISQLVTIYDYEGTPGTDYTYTATVVTGAIYSSPSGTSGSISVPLSLGFWEMDPTDYTTAINAQPTAWNPQSYEQSAVHPVLSQNTVNVVAAAMQIPDINATFETFYASIYQKIYNLTISQKTIFVSDPFGYSYYFRFAPAPGGLSMGVGNKAHDASLVASAASGPHRNITVTGVGQPRPAV